MLDTQIAFFDLEVNPQTQKITDIGCIWSDTATFHKNNVAEFVQFIKPADFLCGHNILAHDLKYLQKHKFDVQANKVIDTLLLSPLLFPQNPYHRLLKDDKLQTDELNNPLNDAKKAQALFLDEQLAFHNLNEDFKNILISLLFPAAGFTAFFIYNNCPAPEQSVEETEIIIRRFFNGHICANSDIPVLFKQSPVSLAYALALLYANDKYSITPPWVLKNYPDVERIFFLLRNNRCLTGCNYCNLALNPFIALKKHFGFSAFRSYAGEPLQENAVVAAIHSKSILAVFPTGGGKSITFQLPALMSGDNAKALTVVISPLQSLMKDQVDNLERRGITEAVTINGLLDPIERSKTIERIENGHASILYIAPESLRSVTIERLLLKRKIARFVIDEAHCFSSWGQDFRVDYLYIGDFILALQKKKELEEPIPVSCFTATAKQKVIEDIGDYFKQKLNLTLELFTTNAARTNLHYKVYQKDNEEDKYTQLRSIIESKECPAIVYVSRTRRAYQLAQRLVEDGFNARPYHGKMDKEEKSTNQNGFMSGEIDIMVATSAFGMGVDKADVGSVIHYDISDSLENYIQEAGRAGRDESIEADCYVLFNEEDLDKHFILLNQTKISSKEINQVWKAIKDLTKTRDKASNSALEIARRAGWDDQLAEIETRVTTAIAALEEAGYLKRGQNMPSIFANSILSNDAAEAIDKINSSNRFNNEQKTKAIRIIKKLFSSKSKRLSTDEAAESRVDYIAEQLGFAKAEVIRIIEILREEKVLALTRDLTAFIRKSENVNRSLAISDSYRKQEELLLSIITETGATYHLKDINEQFVEAGIKDSSIHKLKTMLNFWTIKHWIKRQTLDNSKNHIHLTLNILKEEFRDKLSKRHIATKLITEFLYKKSNDEQPENKFDDVLVEFSVLELKEMVEKDHGMFAIKFSLDDIEDALFYLSRIEAIKIEGGFLVTYNRLTIDRLEKNNRIQFKESDYEKLNQFYQQKVQQIHIVGEYAKKMIRNYEEALQFVDDYFTLNYSSFLAKYFPGSRQDEIKRTLTPEKFRKLFGALSPAQLQIIKDSQSQYIVVAAGPGSGKTKVLVHKLASLLLAEDVKHEQLLMLTFSRAAATEFKKRLLELIGNAAHFIEIKTFHSYCFDLLGRVGNLKQVDGILNSTVLSIREGDIEPSLITKAVVVVDEAQDMSKDEYELVLALIERNEEMRVILVGDDDQNIYGFRGSNSKFMQEFISEKIATKYELTDNYRSKKDIVEFSNQWVEQLNNRLKSIPGFAVVRQPGSIKITQYSSSELLMPLVSSISLTGLSGTTCVLTSTNDEAVQITGLLNEKGILAKLIQTNDGFNLCNLCELRYFTDLLNSYDFPLIGEEEWKTAKATFASTFEKSSKLELALNVIKDFSIINSNRKYKTDWKTFLNESRIEDFMDIDAETIFVSTIHKAKGKEFNNVFMMLKDFNPVPEENKRKLYVGITRTKSNLQIHYNGKFLSGFSGENLSYTTDSNTYIVPAQIELHLTHQNVYLGYFEYVQKRMLGMQSGDMLKILEGGLGNLKGELVLKYSSSFKEFLQLKSKQGYTTVRAVIHFLVYWKGEDKEMEVKIILPRIVLRRETRSDKI